MDANEITSWRQFKRRVRDRGAPFLAQLDRYPGAVLVAGCQRSGTTALMRVITAAEEVIDFRQSRDEELDGAKILAGVAAGPTGGGRLCFQTTYLNERYPEYFEHTDYLLVWMVRNPFSVIYSFMHHWKRFALNELFDGCGRELLNERERHRYERFGRWSVPLLRRACLAYNAKSSQLFRLVDRLPAERLRVISYDDLIRNKVAILTELFAFLDIPYQATYGERIHGRSGMKQEHLSNLAIDIIDATCRPVYDQLITLVSRSMPHEHPSFDAPQVACPSC